MLQALPGTPGALASDVSSVLELMRQTRENLADRLAQSQQACADMIHELHLSGTHAQVPEGDQPAEGRSCEDGPGAATEEHQAAASGLAEAEQLDGNSRPAVLGGSTRFNISQATLVHEVSSKPAGKQKGERRAEGTNSPARGASSNEDCEAARNWVRQLHATHTPFDIGGFLTALGCEGIDSSDPVSREEFEEIKRQGLQALEDMADYESANLQAVAAEAAPLLRSWIWPVGQVAAPPPSPQWFARLGLNW